MRTVQTKTVESVTQSLIDYRGKTPTKTTSGVKLITAKVVKDGFIQDGEHEFIATEDYDAWMRRGLPKQWDILLTTEAPLGEVAQLRTPERIALAQRIILLRGDPTVIHQGFYFQALKSPFVQAGLKARSSGTTVAGIKQSELRQVEIPCPPLPIQRRIASILSAYDDLIENNTRRITILEDMAQMLYREWFVNFRFPGHEKMRMVDSELGPKPEGWSVRPLAEIYRTGSGGTPSRKVPSYFGGTIRWVKTQELLDCFIHETDEKITEEGLKNSSAKLYPEGTLLMAMYGATIGKLGLLATEATCNQASCAMLPKTPGFGPEFLYLTLLTRRTDILALRMGAAQQNISQEVIKAFPIVRPETNVITTFTDRAAPIFRLIGVLQAKNQNLRTTRDLLLPKLISGEIPVEAADETAAELMEEVAQPA